MIRKSTQDWSIGNIVNVGFMKLRVDDISAVKDGLPDIYYLTDVRNNRQYQFIPHFGLERIK